VADSGFRPDPNGFNFQNFGTTLDDGTVPTNLTPADVRALFGDGVGSRESAREPHVDVEC
jgi:hypothetical protein